jgi:GNAT superfamily N-acetyltransferase
MTTDASIQAVLAYWAAHLGCDREQLARPGTSVVRNGPDLADYCGVTVMSRPPACVVAVPDDWYELAAGRLGPRAAAEVFDIPLLRGVFGSAVERVIGPAWLGYADAGDFTPAPTMGARPLTDRDLPALRRLADACGPTAWEHGGIRPGSSPVFGCHVGDALAAAGMLQPWGPRLLHVGIVTHPAHRGRGYGKAVVSAMTAHGLAAGGVVQYRTLEANLASVGIARALGFRRFARTLAVRLARSPGR